MGLRPNNDRLRYYGDRLHCNEDGRHSNKDGLLFDIASLPSQTLCISLRNP